MVFKITDPDKVSREIVLVILKKSLPIIRIMDSDLSVIIIIIIVIWTPPCKRMLKHIDFIYINFIESFPCFYSDSGDINGIFVGLTVVKTQTEMFVCIRHFQKV